MKDIESTRKEFLENLTLTEDQGATLFSLFSGKNIFLSGEPGTGKTFLLETYIMMQRELGRGVAITATTGIAAVNLDPCARTIHSLLRFIPDFKGEYDYEKCCKELTANHTLIIDEVSMLTPDIASHLAKCLHTIEREHWPQIVVCGDFHQLPPVIKEPQKKVYAFELPFWKELDLQPMILHQVVRQQDPVFIDHLRRIRNGDPFAVRYFNECANKEFLEQGVILCTKNVTASRYNRRAMEALPGEEKSYRLEKEIEGIPNLKDFPFDPVIRLKVGMKVMTLVNNYEKGYRNGSIGVVKEMHDRMIVVEFSNGLCVEIERVSQSVQNMDPKSKNEVMIVNQFPLRAAYAITIHKSQGLTFENVNIDAPDCWDYGQLYVALSRAKSISGIHLMDPIRQSCVRTSPRVLTFYQTLEKQVAA
ncbi:MAG: AAA family ATPase [Lachnospiraceae bacterium]|nr:AAA family ATPase [Lachnospiraceae bacterium]